MSKECPTTGEVVLYLECLECDDKICRDKNPRMSDTEVEEHMMDVLQTECDKYGYKCEDIFGTIYISSKFEHWSFKPYREGNYIKLMHQNPYGKKIEWHKQFTEKLTYVQLVRYIYEHEHAKFYPGFFPTTVIKNHPKDTYNRSARNRSRMKYATI